MTADEPLPSRQRRGAKRLSNKPCITETLASNNAPQSAVGEEENEGGCCECDNGGELICCDYCVRAYHTVCLKPPDRSFGRRLWACPVCAHFQLNEDLDKRRGVLLELNCYLPVPSSKSIHLSRCDFQRQKEDADGSPDGDDSNSPGASNGSDTESDSSSPAKVFMRKASLKPLLFRGLRTDRAPNRAGIVPQSGRINIGSAYQVQTLPQSFMSLQQKGKSYANSINSRTATAAADTSVVYSYTAWKAQAHYLGTTAVPESSQVAEDAKLSPALLDSAFPNSSTVNVASSPEPSAAPPPEPSAGALPETSADSAVKGNLLAAECQWAEGEAKRRRLQTFVDTPAKLVDFCEALAAAWSGRCCWPYCEEYAYKILYHAGFDAAKAMQLYHSPDFDFYGICDPPIRPYYNKWRPEDRRGTFPATPFPPPLFLKAAIGPIGGARTRHQTTFIHR